ncbi:TPA: LysR substrate-binding domain-containing protein [Photobacterium damselae]
MNKVSWKGIRAFIYVAEHGSFTIAARILGSSKANVSQLVTELENSLGVQLLFRTTRKLRLTDIGDGYYQRCKIAMLQLNSAKEWATESKSELKGRIRMNSVGGPIGEDLIAPLVMSFQKQYPDIEVELDFSNTQVDLLEQQYDLVLRVGLLSNSSLIARHLCELTTYYVASPDFLNSYGPITTPEDLEHLPLIYGSIDHWVLKNGEEQKIIHMKKGMKVATGRTMRQAAISGLGVTRLTDVYCHTDIQNNRLIDVLPNWSEKTPLSLVCPPTKYHLLRVRTLMNWIVDRFYKEY